MQGELIKHTEYMHSHCIVYKTEGLTTVLPAKSDSDVVFCLQLLRKSLTCTLHLSLYESIDHLCINHIHRI